MVFSLEEKVEIVLFWYKGKVKPKSRLCGECSMKYDDLSQSILILISRNVSRFDTPSTVSSTHNISEDRPAMWSRA